MLVSRQTFVLCLVTFAPTQAERLVTSELNRFAQLSARSEIVRTGGGTDTRLDDTIWWKSESESTTTTTIGRPRTCEGYASVPLADEDDRNVEKKDCECVAPFELFCDLEGNQETMEAWRHVLWVREKRKQWQHGQRVFNSQTSDPNKCQCKMPPVRCMGSVMHLHGFESEGFEPCLVHVGVGKTYAVIIKNIAYPLIELDNDTCKSTHEFCHYPVKAKDDCRNDCDHRDDFDMTMTYDDCGNWARDFCILPGHYFGKANLSIRRKWQAFGCYQWPNERGGDSCACKWGCKCQSIKDKGVEVHNGSVSLWGSATELEKAWWNGVHCDR